MRTIAATFATRDEVEAARRRLTAIGVSPDEVVVRDLGETGRESGPGGAEGSLPAPAGIFISVKVSPDQAAAAAEILKGQRTDDPAVRSAASIGSLGKTEMAEGEQIGTGASLKGQPLPVGPSHPELKSPPLGGDQQHRSRQTGAPSGDWRRWSRQIVIFCLVLVVAFIAGALLGLVT